LNPHGSAWAEDHVTTIDTGPDDGVLIADERLAVGTLVSLSGASWPTTQALTNYRVKADGLQKSQTGTSPL
jgi:hypothetical protein